MGVYLSKRLLYMNVPLFSFVIHKVFIIVPPAQYYGPMSRFFVPLACPQGVGRECIEENHRNCTRHHCPSNAWEMIGKCCSLLTRIPSTRPSSIWTNANTCPMPITSMRYITEVWRPKTSMWYVGARWISYP